MKLKRSSRLDPLQSIPGVGPSIARDLRELGIRRVEDLKGRNPEHLYARSNSLRGVRQDRCLLYVFRCAVYFATATRPDPARLKWWAWKDARPADQRPNPGAQRPGGSTEQRRKRAPRGKGANRSI